MANIPPLLKAYPFVQYAEDEQVSAFFTAFNQMANDYYADMQQLVLGLYTNPIMQGALLDWIALGIYGYDRARLVTYDSKRPEGAYNTFAYNTTIYNQIQSFAISSIGYLSDDWFKRVLTWNIYAGDGAQFTMEWLKRRLKRFFERNGEDTTPIDGNTDNYSVTVENGTFTIKISNQDEDLVNFFKVAISEGILKLPFTYTFVVD